MPLYLIEKNITKMKTDAIVNAANTKLMCGGGVCGDIFKAAGQDSLSRACKEIGGVETGKAVITPGFSLPAKYIIHTAGPKWAKGNSDQAERLRDCYLNSLRLAQEHGCESIAFPLISSGIYGYPAKEAMEIAVKAIREFLQDSDMVVYMTVFDRFALNVPKDLKEDLAAYVSSRLDSLLENRGLLKEKSHPKCLSRRCYNEVSENLSLEYNADSLEGAKMCYSLSSLKELVNKIDKSFSETVMELIESRNLDPIMVYKDANLDRKLFSKIKTNKEYLPSKATAVSLALALHLDRQEAAELIAKAGYAFSPANKGDLIVEYFLEHGIYDILTLNEALLDYGQKPFGPM